MMVAKYQTGSKWISSIDVHPGGDNFIIGTYDKKIHWFDMDMGAKPYKNLKYHDKAIRNVRYSPKHPLFSSCSDDGTVIIKNIKLLTYVGQQINIVYLMRITPNPFEEELTKPVRQKEGIGQLIGYMVRPN